MEARVPAHRLAACAAIARLRTLADGFLHSAPFHQRPQAPLFYHPGADRFGKAIEGERVVLDVEDALREAGLAPTERAERVEIEGFAALARAVEARRKA